MLIGYARVSTEDQNLDLQRDALKRVGCERIFEEKESGRAGTKRPAFEAALAYLRPEDQLVVWKVDRLGRSLRPLRWLTCVSMISAWSLPKTHANSGGPFGFHERGTKRLSDRRMKIVTILSHSVQ